jgi:tetratricopeptide (TPR) repeat protein
MTEWYRRKSWTKTDEEEFFKKLGRARVSGRAQYLKIQAIELIMTENESLLKIAIGLLNKMLIEYPDEKFERAGALTALGNIYKLQGDFDEAICHFKQAIDFEKVYSQSQTNAYLDYSELIIKTGKTTLFNEVEDVLLAHQPKVAFPAYQYKVSGLLSIIYKKQPDKAIYYANLAEQSALVETSGFRYHKNLGLVKERDMWLENAIHNNLV